MTEIEERRFEREKLQEELTRARSELIRRDPERAAALDKYVKAFAIPKSKELRRADARNPISECRMSIAEWKEGVTPV